MKIGCVHEGTIVHSTYIYNIYLFIFKYILHVHMIYMYAFVICGHIYF
jgi:hypothetical protein